MAALTAKERLRHYPIAQHAYEHLAASGPQSVASIRSYLILQAKGVDEANAEIVTDTAIAQLIKLNLIEPAGSDVYDLKAGQE